ncbi:MAG: S1 RNA-binding domain-containing protein [Turicibacter sp.]|nr:S1 RNA-binding domain-containing protein [Turicibacter sp.]
MEEYVESRININTENEIKEGVVRLVQYDVVLNDYTVWLELDGNKVIIPRQELELYQIKGSLNHYIGMKIQYMITDYEAHRQVYIGSCKEVQYQKRQEIIKRLKDGETFEAKVTRLVYFGAYLSINGVSVILRNQDFSNDYTVVSDVYKEGDRIEVCYLRVNENQKINVQAVTKYESKSSITIADFEPQPVVYGVVRSVKSWACFVNIAPNLDAICPVPTYFDVKEGMKVAFRINQVRPEEGRVRGKIIKVIESGSINK